MPKYLLTNEALATERWLALVTNPAYSEDLTTKATVGKSAICTYWKFRPAVTVTNGGDFPNISLAKSGWLIRPEAILINTISNIIVSIYGGSNTKVGQRFTVQNRKIYSVYFILRKVNLPTGNAIITIRKVSDNSIIAQSANFDVSTLTIFAEWYSFIFTTTPTINEEVRILFEYSGGDATNSVNLWYQNTDVINGVHTRASDTVFTDYPDYDTGIVVYGEPYFNGSFASGDWTFKVRFESSTKYGFSVKVAVRLSRSVNADGSNATLIAVSESPNVIAIPASAGGSVTDSWTYNASEITLTDEYLFVEYRIHIEVAGTNAGAQCSFACDENPATADESVTTTTFTPILVDMFKALQYFTEPPSAGWNKLRYENEPPTGNAWNKLLYEGE